MKVAEITTLLSIRCTAKSHAPPQLGPRPAVRVVPGGPTCPVLRLTHTPQARRGRWEGRTLIVDTVSFNGRISTRGSDDHLHLVERFTRTDADTIRYEFTMDDPTVWVRPWSAAFPLHRSDEPMYEYACHEGNAMSMEGLLRAARVDEHPPRER